MYARSMRSAVAGSRAAASAAATTATAAADAEAAKLPLDTKYATASRVPTHNSSSGGRVSVLRDRSVAAVIG